jgi:hypothetical protein
MVTTKPRKVSPNSPFATIICPMCNERKSEWNKHHFSDGWKRVCVDCHNKINYYVAPYEQKTFRIEDLNLLIGLISMRERNESDS